MELINEYNQAYIDAVKYSTFRSLVKVELLDNYEHSISEITNEISADSSGSINLSYQQGVRGTVNFSIFDVKDDFLAGNKGSYMPTENGGTFWVGKKMKVSLGLSTDTINEQGKREEEIFWFSKGVYIINDISVNKDESGTLITISGVDKFGFFTSDTGYNELQGTYVIPFETPICNSVRDLLTEDMGNGFPIDPKTPIFAPSIINEISPFDINKGPGSYLGDFLIEIANVLGCDIFYDYEGHLNFALGTIDSYYNDKSIVWIFKDGDPEYISSSIQYNLKDVVNIVKVVGDNINEQIFTSVARNDNPSSSTRVDLIGKKEKYITSSFVYNQDRADDYAQYELNRRSIVQKTLSFNCTFLPHLNLNEMIVLHDPTYNLDQAKFIIQSLSYEFGSGTMTITGTELADLPYYELREGTML